MIQKKSLDITAKDWSAKDKLKLEQKINEQNYQWKATINTRESKTKYCYFYSKIDLEIMALQEGFTILKVAKI